MLVLYNPILSPLQPNDAGLVVEHMRDKGIYNNTIHIPFPYNRGHADLWIEDSLIFAEENGFSRNFAIRDSEGKIMGAIGLQFNYGLNSKKSEIGYWLSKQYWGHGVMTSAVKKLCELAKEQYKMEVLEAHVFSTNIASQNVLLKSGFTRAQKLEKWFKKEGRNLAAIKYTRTL